MNADNHELADVTVDEQNPNVEATSVLDDLVRDLVFGAGTSEEMTPYLVHSIVNTVFEALEVEYRVRPQMMYNYDRNGLIVKGQKGKKRFTRDEVLDFVTRFVNRNINR